MSNKDITRGLGCRDRRKPELGRNTSRISCATKPCSDFVTQIDLYRGSANSKSIRLAFLSRTQSSAIPCFLIMVFSKILDWMSIIAEQYRLYLKNSGLRRHIIELHPRCAHSKILPSRV